MDGDFIRILLAEDNPQDVMLIYESLTSACIDNFELQLVERISSALKLTERDQFDVILLGLSLPDSNGLGTIKAMCSADLPIPIIVLNDL